MGWKSIRPLWIHSLEWTRGEHWLDTSSILCKIFDYCGPPTCNPSLPLWYIFALNLLSWNSCGPKKVESKTISLLKMSKVTMGYQVNIQSSLVLILSNIMSKDLESIKHSLYNLYMDFKLPECAPSLPEGFFPNYNNVRECCEFLQDLKSGKVASIVKNIYLLIRKHVASIRIQIQSIRMRIWFTKFLTIKKLGRQTRKISVLNILGKRHGGTGRRKRLKSINLGAFHVSIDGVMTIGSRKLCGMI